ncbi:hypothetical protein A2592_00940 [Candidatus Kaiserbacteria bacterium RIFOXYD1_FULL_42_15]|uniref:Uncharacterized protein n=1 Tax=Candidatus Kaiserbacteria bacterium RIFOXYD1_FULL_42_15 TaxID=1798532 RepID=A0A1F6FPA5_9BACT|nr:MAG: hypothetical protein A2592_00940 [Candidatus Kaiserbacteria bacterium RIFOXYD1_FULL_42_15]
MRIILIIQALIILAGSYYIFVLLSVPDTESIIESNDIATTTTERAVISNESIKVGAETSSTTMGNDTGDQSNSPNDYGMEYPIADDNPQVQ